MPHKPILIVGGGIGGLATALALAQRGRPSVVLERHATFSEAGAGIQIGPNGMRVLATLGVDRFLEPWAGKPEFIRLQDAVSGKRLIDLPIGETFAQRHGAPYRTAHRADLQAALLEAVRKAPLITVQTSFEVSALDDDGASVRARTAAGRSIEGIAAIAADGAWSKMRQKIIDDSPLPASSHTAARTLIPAEDVQNEAVDPHGVTVWMARDAHVVYYPVRGGRQLAVVFVIEEDGGGTDWSTPAQAAELAPHLSRLARPLRSFLGQGRDWRKWSLYDVKPLRRWAKGRIALLGDAAHPPLPFFAQGGVMALEDAVTVADSLVTHGDPAQAFMDYETRRMSRAEAVKKASRTNGRIYHLAGPMAIARNLALRTANPERMMARYDWLYGWRSA